MGRFIDMTGFRSGRLTVIGEADGRDPLGNVLWRCACDCGREHVTNGVGLRHGRVRSCGCLQRDTARSQPIAQPEPLAMRLARNTNAGAPGECWLWTGAVDRIGYGKMRFGGVNTTAHRLAYEVHNGSIPEGMVVMHRCDNPPCVNPAHLRLGTAFDNMQDMVGKGRNNPQVGTLNGNSRLTNDQVREIRRRLDSGDSMNSLATAFGVSKKSILNIKHRRSWAHIV